MKLPNLPPAWSAPVALPRLVRLAVADWLFMAVAAATAFAWPWLWPLAWLGIAGRLQALGVLLHDVCHSRHRRGVWYRIVETLCGLPIGTTIAAMRFHHLRHHRSSCTRHDPYLKPSLTQSPWARWRYTAQGMLLVPFWWVRIMLGTLLWLLPRGGQDRCLAVYGRVFLQEPTGASWRPAWQREVRACARQEWRGFIWLTCVCGAVYFFPLPTLLAYGVPLFLAAMLNANRVICEHTHEVLAIPRREDVLATTHDHVHGWFNRWILYPHNIGYHQAHHLFPGVALYHLPAVQRWLTEQAMAPPAPARAAAWSANTGHDQSRGRPWRFGRGRDGVKIPAACAATPSPKYGTRRRGPRPEPTRSGGGGNYQSNGPDPATSRP